MATVSESLSNAIESWCGLTPIQYAPTDGLSTLWTRTGNPAPYDSAGIRSLMECIYRRHIFRDCEQALNMTIGMFQTGGGLQTRRDLFLHLENC